MGYDRLLYLYPDGGPTTFAWSHSPARLTVVTADYRSVVQLMPPSSVRSTLFTQDAGDLCPLAWTPDDRSLIFVLCRRDNLDREVPPAQLYVYSLPT